MPLALYLLAFGAFAVGTAEFIIAGLLPTLAGDLNVGIPAAGLLVSGYALSVAIGGPILALATARVPRKPMIVGTITLFALGQALCAIAPTYELLMAARILVALTHGLFFGNATIAARALVTPDRRGQAMALVLAGVPLANLLGVPVGAALGHWLGWRMSFWTIGGLAALATLTIIATLPRVRDEADANTVPWRAQLAVLFRHQIALSYLALTVLLTGALALFTFFVPFLVGITRVSEADTPPYLFAYGAGAIVGIFVGGRLSDWKLMPALVGSCFAYAAVAAAILILMHSGVGMFIAALLLGVAFYTFTVPPQTRIVNFSAGAPTLAATFIATAFNVGYALGAFLGAALLSAGFGYASLPVAAIACGMLAGLISLWSSRLDRAR